VHLWLNVYNGFKILWTVAFFRRLRDEVRSWIEKNFDTLDE